MISIVIPYLQRLSDSQSTDELKYVIRAWEKYAQFDFEIILIGDCPDWFNGICITCSPIRGMQFARSFDIANKLSIVCGTPEVTDDFLYTYDDVFPVSEITEEDIMQVISTGVINKRRIHQTGAGSNKWNRLLRATLDEVKELPVLHGYETHLPRILNKEKLARLIYDYDLKQTPFLFSTLYYNEYIEHPDLIIHEKHPYRVWLKRLGSAEEVANRVKNAKYLNYGENHWKGGIEQYMERELNNASNYERCTTATELKVTSKK
jgi:hypothetical protein